MEPLPQEKKEMETAPVLLFDGVCNLCEGSVRFILKRDPRGIFRFASLQSQAGQALLKRFQLPTDDFDTMVLIEQDRVFTQSSAALRVAKRLTFPWPFFAIFWVVPRFLRNFFYRIIARNRYRWFGKKEACLIPTPELRSRFLS